MSFHVPNEFRIHEGQLASTDDCGNNGAFKIPVVQGRPLIFMIASDGEGWEHVSVSTPIRCPTWEEMCFIKAMFWEEEDCVMQLHVPKSEWINNHPFCLHLWRPLNEPIPRPSGILVGIK